MLAGVTAVPLAGWGVGTSSSTYAGTATSRSCLPIPEETAGPFPAHGSDGKNALLLSGIVRRDIRPSLGPRRTVAEGVGLELTFELVDANAKCAPLPGLVVYVWQSDRDGRYSMYDPPIERKSYLRGVQAADADGRVTFTTIFPAAYRPRWPHIHFEVYPSLEEATTHRNKVVTSQLALPKEICEAVYEMPGYEASRRDLSELSLESDIAFHDGSALQLPAMTGTPVDGYVATLVVGIAA